MRPGRNDDRESIALVGAGIIGVAAALKLASSGHFDITLLEKEKEIGGLSASYRWQDLVCDRFYHVVLPGDAHTVDFIRDLELGDELFWNKTQTGFYGRQTLVPLSSAFDFVRFPFLSLWQKVRLGIGLLYSVRIKDVSQLDRVSAPAWLAKVFGDKVYKNIWEPLLRSKLGEACERTSAAFIWANIARLYGARKTEVKQEKMGYIRGGYDAVWNAARKKLDALQVKILTDCRVKGLDVDSRSGQIGLQTHQGSLGCDRVLFTAACPEIAHILGSRDQSPYWRNLERVEYLGVVCVLLVLKRRLSPYYVINLLDRNLPFTGIIESTNVIPPQDFGHRHLLYLPKYLTRDDPLNSLTDEQIASLFIQNLKKVYPEMPDGDIVHHQVFREAFVQPVQELDFLGRSIGFETPLRNVYVANSSMIYDSTINNNAALKIAGSVASLLTGRARTR